MELALGELALGTRGLPLTEADDTLLVQAFARGDRTAFEQVVACHQGRVTRLVHRLLGWSGTAEDVDDLVQEVFLSAMSQSGRFKGDCSLSTWLTAITLNRCRTFHRRRLLRWRFWSTALRSAAATSPAADRAALDDEVSKQVRASVAGLPPRLREVVVLYYLEGKSAAEISGLLRVSPNAVDIRLHRARARLKAALAHVARP